MTGRYQFQKKDIRPDLRNVSLQANEKFTQIFITKG